MFARLLWGGLVRGLPSARAPSTPALRTCRAEFSKGRCAPVPRAVVLCVRACVPACACVCVCSGGEAWSDPARPLPLLATRACERCVGRQHLRGQFFPREMERILPARDVRELATVPNMPVTTPLHTHTQCPICRSRPPTHTHCPTCRSRPPTPTHSVQYAGHDPPPPHTVSNMPITTPPPPCPPVPTMPVAAPMHIAPRRRAARLGRPRMHGPPQAPAARDQGRVAWAAWQALQVAILESHALLIQWARATVASAGSR